MNSRPRVDWCRSWPEKGVFRETLEVVHRHRSRLHGHGEREQRNFFHPGLWAWWCWSRVLLHSTRDVGLEFIDVAQVNAVSTACYPLVLCGLPPSELVRPPWSRELPGFVIPAWIAGVLSSPEWRAGSGCGLVRRPVRLSNRWALRAALPLGFGRLRPLHGWHMRPFQ